MDEQTTIVGRPTYMATFPGQHEAAPIVAALTATGYPTEDISILFRPAGGDAVVDLMSGENAAGQDADAQAEAAKQGAGTTLVLLHPAEDQLAAVRAALAGLGGQEFGYEGESVAHDDQMTALGEPTLSAANRQDAGDSIDTAKKADDGQGKNEGTTTGAAGTPDTSSATMPAKFGAPDPTGDPLMAETPVDPHQMVAHFDVPTHHAGAHATAGPPPPLPDTTDLKAKIEELKDEVDAVKHELETRDDGKA
ncbi:MAG: hypothetical protein M3Z04_25190 [Chloroflexota bacterium]|nr:hypothetical protein [Chloroflexota bacterium]